MHAAILHNAARETLTRDCFPGSSGSMVEHLSSEQKVVGSSPILVYESKRRRHDTTMREGHLFRSSILHVPRRLLYAEKFSIKSSTFYKYHPYTYIWKCFHRSSFISLYFKSYENSQILNPLFKVSLYLSFILPVAYTVRTTEVK